MNVARRPLGWTVLTVVGGGIAFGWFSDIMFLWNTRGIRASQLPYLDRVVEYPVVSGWTLWFVSAPAWSQWSALGWWIVVAALAAALVTRLLQLLGVTRLGAWIFAPQLAFFGAHNLDLLAIVPALGALLAWESGASATAGALVAIGASAKLFPVVLMAAFLAVGGRGARATVRATIAFATTTLALNVPFAISNAHRWWWTFEFQARRTPTWASVWFYALHDVHLRAYFDHATMVRIANVGGLAMLALLLLTVAFVARRRRLDVRSVVLVMLIAWIVSSKIYSPQYDLWLIPFLVVAGVGAKHLRRLAVVDVAMIVTVFFVPLDASTKVWLVAGVVAARLVVLGAIVLAVTARPTAIQRGVVPETAGLLGS